MITIENILCILSITAFNTGPSIFPVSASLFFNIRAQSMYQSRHCLVEAADPVQLEIVTPARLGRAVRHL